MYKENKNKGTHCQVCIGCGRCTDTVGGIHIVSQNLLRDESALGGALRKYLVTVDIGSTTVAMQLYNLDGSLLDSFLCVNPQGEYGADVLSRIQAAKKPVHAKKMQCMIRQVLKQGIERFQKRVDKKELYMVLAANTTMIYLLMGFETWELGRAPFIATHLQEMWTDIEGVPCYIFPGISAFVGGDIVAGLYALDMLKQEELTLFIDLGTNGEIVLGNKHKRIACSTAAGPAFEGGPNRGIWGADMISILARLLRKGIVDETGLLADAYFEEGVLVGKVRVTQQAIRNIQLAKAAIAAGIEILVKEYGVTLREIGKVVLAGGLGYFLNPQDAAAIGLLPRELVPVTIAGGNMALAGAERYGKAFLRSKETDMWKGIDREFSQTISLNIAKKKEFEEIYLQRINLM